MYFDLECMYHVGAKIIERRNIMEEWEREADYLQWITKEMETGRLPPLVVKVEKPSIAEIIKEEAGDA